jgi:phosphohistidine phosphatase
VTVAKSPQQRGRAVQRIWLIRHGKSSRPFGVVDHQRPLGKRAGRDGALVRRHLRGAPELYVASSALRAVATAEMLAGERPVEVRAELYQASAQEFLNIIEETLPDCANAAFIAHNPTITALVNRLAGRSVADSVPTLGCAAFERDQAGREGQAWRMLDYVVPKGLA